MKKHLPKWILLAALIITAIIIIPKVQAENAKEHFRQSPKSYVSVVNNGYKYNSLFGGISDLKITIVNNSDFTLDHVRVGVSYIRKNGSKYKDELVDAEYIPAHGQATVSAPDSDAGMTVELSIYVVTSAEAGAY